MSKTHHKHLQDRYFNLIADGSKTCEIRMNRGSSLEINEGDNILFYKDDGIEVLVLVNSILIMDNIGVALNNHLESALPDISNVDEGIELYVEIYGADVFSNQVRCIFIENVV